MNTIFGERDMSSVQNDMKETNTHLHICGCSLQFIARRRVCYAVCALRFEGTRKARIHFNNQNHEDTNKFCQCFGESVSKLMGRCTDLDARI